MTQYDELRRANAAVVRAAEAAGLGTYDAYPLRVTLELTAGCNLRCPHCEFTPARAWVEQNDPKRILWLPPDELRVFAAAVFPHIREVVPSVVGEPMMYPYWQDFLDLCAQYGVFAEIYTNGTYLDEKTLPPLAPVVQKLIVSMDGASRATFNQLRKPADFDDVCARLEVVRAWRASLPIEERPRLQIHSVLTLHWVDELPEMVRLVERHGVDELSVSHVVVYSDYWRGFSPSADQARTDAALRAAGEEARRLGVSVHLPRLFGTGENVSHRAAPAFPVRDKVEPIPPPAGREYWCQYLWREAFVAHSGTVAPCCGLGRPAVGDLRADLDLKKLFGHPTFAAMREGMIAGKLHEACARCPQLSMYGALDYRNASFTGTYASLEAVLAEQRRRTP